MPIRTITLPMCTGLVSKTGVQLSWCGLWGTAAQAIRLVFHDERVYWMRN
jgi:hypothetical protein